MKHDLIFSRAINDGTLNAERIQQLAPAVYTEEKSAERSARYAHINTAQAIDILADYGYNVTQAAQVRNRTQEAAKYGQHMIALSNPDLPETDDGRPEIILYNSGDGKSAVRMFAGFYRFICSNGVIAGNGFEVKAGHYQTTATRFEKMIKEAAQRLPDMLQQIEGLKAFPLDGYQDKLLADKAARIRWRSLDDQPENEPLKPGTYAAGSTAWHLLKINRAEDMAPNAWITFNRMQERLIRGGAEVLSVTKRNPRGKYRRSKAVGSVANSLKINRDLWDLFDLKNLEQVAA